MLAVLLPLSLGLLFIAVRLAASAQSGSIGRRSEFLAASVLWGVLLTGITESLGAFSLISRGWLAGAWGAVCISVLLVCLLFLWKRRPGDAPFLSGISSMPRGSIVLIGAVLALVAVVGVIALVAAPNDSEKYHMMRVVHWIQDCNVANYPSEFLPQLYQPPWAEFAILHLQLLSGGDRFANLVQWFSMAGSIVGVSLIARQLGADRRGQILAAVIAATIPMGIVQASAPNNTYAVSFWLVCAVYFLLSLRSRFTWTKVVLAGGSVGLALLTKGTAYLFLLPFALWFAAWGWRTLRLRLWLPAGLILMIALAINAPYLERNIALFQNPFGPEGATYANQLHTPAAVLSNSIRNLSLHLAVPDHRANELIERQIYNLHRVIGINPNDRRTTWKGRVFHLNPATTHESTTGNPLHLLLIVFTAACCLILARLRRTPGVVPYLASLLGGFLLFCFYLKWQPWNSRLHLPLFVLFCPLCGLVLSRLRNVRIGTAVALALLVGSLPWVFAGESRPVWGSRSIFTLPRLEQYFVDLANLEPGYLGAARVVGSAGCTQVGLAWGNVNYRVGYPLWIALRTSGRHDIRVEDVVVDNASARLSAVPPFSTFHPCSIVSIARPQTNRIQYRGRVYRRVWSSGLVSAYGGLPYPKAAGSAAGVQR